MKLLRTNRSTRNPSGVGALEVAISAGLMIIVVALAVDVTILNYAFTVNDAACRDAARAMAAQANPYPSNPSPGNPVGAAQAALKSHPTDGYLISQPLLRTSALGVNSDLVYQAPAWGTAAPAGTTPTVTCTTYVDVRLPVPLVFWGNNASNYLSSNGGKIRFIRRYTFPVVNQSVQ